MSELNTDGTTPPDATAPAGTAGETAGDLTVAELRDWMRAWVSQATGLPEDQISDDRPMDEFGLSSRDAVSLAADVEDKTGVVLTATVAFAHPTIASLAKRIIEGDPDAGDDDADDAQYRRERGADDDIAVVGLSTRFPKAGETPESTWDFLISGGDGISDLPEDRWTEFKADPRLKEILDEANTRGGYLDDVKGFDADFFQMSPREAEMVDPQQRLALELTWEALEHAHIPPSDLAGEQVGVFIGTSTNDYQLLAVADPESNGDTAAYGLTGTATSIIANRVSYYFDFHGPSVAMDTACSSSLVAVHQAVRSLRSGESDVALAGGVNMLLTPAASLGFDSIGAVAKDGRIKAFSSDADGMVRAEGGGLLVLKRLSDARRDGDTVLAVVAGSAVNSDGRSNGLPAPNPEAQVSVLKAAYRDAAIHPRDVDYIDAHGTGTPIGDPIEADALGRVIGRGRDADRPLLLGSAKTNFGHIESGAGAAGLAKAILAMGKGTIPPSINYAGPNPYIQFDANHLKVVTEPTEFPEYSGNKVVGVSGFGFGGTNAHVVLRGVTAADLADPAAEPVAEIEAPQVDSVDADADDDEYLTDAERAAMGAFAAAKTEPEAVAAEADPTKDFALCKAEGSVIPLVVSGFIAPRRRKSAQDLADWLETDEGRNTPLVDVGRALAHRNHGRTRSVVMARTHEDAVAGLRAIVEKKNHPLVFSSNSPDPASAVWILSGFGTQHRKMGKQLYTENPIFAAAVDRVDAVIQDELGYSMVEQFLDDEVTYGIETAQIGIYTIQIGLIELLRHHGAEPGVVIGHSMGEAAGAYLTGGLSLEDATLLICHRSRLMGEGDAMLSGDDIKPMALVEYSAEDITTVLADYPDLEICVYAAPTHTVIGGPVAQIDAIVARAEAEGKLGRKLNTKGASHTSQMEPLLGELAYEIGGITPKKLEFGFYSSVDKETFYRPGDGPVHTVDYFTKGLRHSVWFSQAITKSVENGHTTFLEISPNPGVLISVAAVTFGAGVQNAELIETLRRKEDESHGVINALMKLYLHGHPVNVGSLFGAGDYANIPRTAFERKPLWLTVNLASGGGTGKVPGSHVALPDGRHVWEVNATAAPDLQALVSAAAASVLTNVVLTGFEHRGSGAAATRYTTTLTPHPGGASIQVHAQTEGGFVPVADAVVTAGGAAPTLPAPAATPVDEAPAVVDDDDDESIGSRWDPESGESVEDRLASIIAESMGYEAEDLPREVPLIDLGLDSLMGMRIKNRAEYEFDIPPMQLQVLRDANMLDVVKFITYAVEHRDQVAALAEHQQEDGGALDTAALGELIDAANAEKEPSTGPSGTPTGHSDAPSGPSGAPSGHSDAPSAPTEPTKPADITDAAAIAAAASADVPPRDAAERLTFGVWAVITGKSAGGIFNPLPELDDDTAAQLAQRLTERARSGEEGGDDKGEITVEQVKSATDIEQLAEHVRSVLEDGSVDGFVRTLRSVENATRPPLLLFHPAGGSTMAYEALLKRLPADQPVIGFDRVEGSLEERVDQYLPKLKEIAPHGPYVLGGWSIGGALALGCAHRLREQGEEVALLALIDLVLPKDTSPETREQKAERLTRWYEFAKRTYNLGDVPFPLELFIDQDDEGQFRVIMDLMKVSGIKIPGGIIEHQRTSFLDNRMVDTVTPLPYDGDVVLYRADRMHDGAIELDPRWADVADDGGWSQYMPNLDRVHIGGDHLQIVDEPYISKVGADLTRRLDDIADRGK